MDKTRQILTDNLQGVEQRLRAACARVGRAREEVTLVGVTKYVSVSVAAMLFELGVYDLGEGRPQELWHKAELLPREVRWHLVGHLQRNKIERTLPLVHSIHSADSPRLLTALEAEETIRPVEVYLEVNCSGEASKQGFAPEDTSIAEHLRSLRRVHVVGLMTMAAHADDPNEARPTFAKLRQMRDELRARVGDIHPLSKLSMGMSGDFEVAIEEGSTCVRLGTILFEGLPPEGES